MSQIQENLTEKYFNFNFEKLVDNSDDNYIELVIKQILSNINSKNFIIEKIKNFVFEKKNILYNYLKANEVNKNDIDILNILTKFYFFIIKN